MPTEVEVKLRLAGKEAHDKLVALLEKDRTHLYRQQNLFYDGADKELSSQRIVLRMRWFNDDEKVVITLKGKMAVVDGVGRAEEHEDEVPVATARAFESDPSSILAVDLPVITTLKERVPVDKLVALGGFKNVRKVVPWQGVTLEIDETQYAWGTVYEVECETEEPEDVRNRLTAFFDAEGIAHKHNTSTKFQNFINQTLE